MRPRPRLRSAVVAVATAAILAGCSSHTNQTETSSSLDSSTAKGGTITAQSMGPVLAWDPQRIGSRADQAFAGRVFARSLTQYEAGSDPGVQQRLVGDLASDTGTSSDGMKTWAFTLRSGVSWQDGTPVTCEDVKYGISRVFATTAITGGAGDALSTLDIPKKPDGTSTYLGPYVEAAKQKAGAAAFDKAVVCVGDTITFHLAAATPDFNEMVSTPAWGPYKKSVDTGRNATYTVFSCGPYQLQGPWNAETGGLFVRNPRWNAASDPVRKAYPDRIRYEQGRSSAQIAQQIMTDDNVGRSSVSLDPAPPALQAQISSSQQLRGRSVNPLSGLVDYLALNMKSKVFADPVVRKAFALATNRAAYVTALGGDTAAAPATSIIPASLPSAHTDAINDGGPRGNPTLAAQSLQEATKKPTGPLKVRIAYRKSQTLDTALAGLASSWRAAGFDPVLTPITNDYFTTISDPKKSSAYDVFWANWAPAWPSASTILPPLLDNRLNVTSVSTGTDYGSVADKTLDAAFDAAAAEPDPLQREKLWADADRIALTQAYYVPLAEHRSLLLAGSRVRNLVGNEVAGGVVDFATIGVSS